MLSPIEMEKAAPVMRQHDTHDEHPDTDRRDRKDLQRDDLRPVILQKNRPRG
jgi:hypothetical protein